MKCEVCGFESEEGSDWFLFDLCTDCAVGKGYVEGGLITECGRDVLRGQG